MLTRIQYLLRSDTPWQWTPHCQEAFDAIRHALTHAPVLTIPDFNKPFELIVDASGIGLGGVLLQDGRPLRAQRAAQAGAAAADREN